MITANITVNLSGEPQLIKVPAKQGDVGSREVSIKFVDNGVIYSIPEETTARIRVTKPDGKYVFNDCTIEDNAVIAPLTAQTLAVAGDAKVDIALYQGENVLLSCSVFILAIMPRAGSDSAVESTDEFGALDSLLQQAETDIPAAHDAAQAANTAAGAANTAAEAANDAAEAANTAKDGADDAANAANTAAGTANTAAEAANSAAQAANTAKEGAFCAAGAANTAAGAANTAAGAANDAAQAANDIVAEVEEKLENGDFVGPPGNLDNVTGAATSILTDNLDASRALVSDGNGKVAVSAVTATELGYLDGVTSGIQSQLDALNSKTSQFFFSSGNQMNVSFPIPYLDWGCGIVIANVNGYGNFIFNFEIISGEVTKNQIIGELGIIDLKIQNGMLSMSAGVYSFRDAILIFA